MIKICSPQLGLSPFSNLGGEVYDYQIIKGLSNLGAKIYVLLPRGKPYEKNKNLKVDHLLIKHVPAYFFNLLALSFIFRTYKREKFDYLRVHDPYFLGFAALIFKKFHPEAKIFTQILLKEDRKDLDFIFSKTYYIYDHFFVLTKYLKSWLIKRHNIDPKKITIIYGGVNEKLKKMKKDPKLINKYGLSGKTVFLNMGRLIERKNVMFLINVFRIINKKYPDTVLFFCGSGPLKSKINDKAKAYGLDNKIFTIGSKFGNEQVKIFNLADLFLFPTKNEGFGLVAAEAMACGIPVVGSDNSSIPEVVDNNITGVLVKTNNLKDWVNKISILMENKDLRNRMSINSIKKVNSIFRWEQVNRTILNSLKNMK